MLRKLNIFKEIIYLLMAMPLGIVYFVLLVAGLSLGSGLLVLGIGVFIIAAVLILARLAGWFEAVLARFLLNADVDLSMDVYYDPSQTYLGNAGRIMTDGKMLRSLLFLALKFPLGIVTFVLTVISITLPAALISAPFTYNNNHMTMMIGTHQVDTLPGAIIAMLVGIMLLPVALFALKTMAVGWRKLAEGLLTSDAYPVKQKRKRSIAHLMNDQYDEYDQLSIEEEPASLKQLLASS